MLKVQVKKFEELSTTELYAILQLRSEVFVVEQDCVYQDVDGKDFKSLHVIGYKDADVAAYTRIFNAGDYFDEASIGRVVVSPKYRKDGFGKEIMNASIAAVKRAYGEDTIRISAQKYLLKFYTSLGFNVVGEEYLEDGIPHMNMIKN
ncbi:GNAT family N-acetyltransferase [Cellulophaga sp. L1A9]|uniref:GNAT family N-acetyltransferase n=1 Tax=Cellulophaga sp. L1A9 TaxID=2686362 RepID=UPI00131C548B|nr:GNAT family N-acetyltransferase [Cellulophaga sp. L1A9]